MHRFGDEPSDDWLPGPEVTRELYLEWRDARRGVVRAAKLNNPVWEWLIRTQIWPFRANQLFQGPDSITAGPAWCFDRYGQTRTTLPDGRTLIIAGEHEDSYDPDFFIYNDVVVWHPDDTIDVHGYPPNDFPPTDFHSATLVGDRIVLVGNLGYVHDRKPGTTQVLSLDTDSLTIEKVQTTAHNPGWIFNHNAQLVENGVVIRGGEIQCKDAVVENIDDWILELQSLQWSRLTDRRWPRFQIVRKDGEMNNLWQMRMDLDLTDFDSNLGLPEETRESVQQSLESVRNLGTPNKPDPILLARLYRPEVDHAPEQLEDEDSGQYGVYRIVVDGVIVRYVEDFHSIAVTVEGRLPESTLDRLISDLVSKLTRLEGAEFVAHRW